MQKGFEDVISAIGAVAILVGIVTLFSYTYRADQLTTARLLKEQHALVESINGKGEVIEIYGYRIGTKAANYRHPVKCVIEGKNGNRIGIEVQDALPVIHDEWEVCVKDSQASLCKLLKSATKE
jgi:hypothetical protein